jgi:hypothetical protein
MRRFICSLSLIAFIILKSTAQESIDTTINLDILKSPVSPAFNLLGISTNAIERPTDLNAFRVSLQNATNNFTTLPKSYAFEIAPFLMGKRKYTLNEFDNNKYTFAQSFVLSAGFTYMGPEGKEDIDSLKTTKTALGIKFSIIRPKWSTATRNTYDSLIEYQKLLLRDFDSLATAYTDTAAMSALETKLQEVSTNTNLPDSVRRAQQKQIVAEMGVLQNEGVEKANKDMKAASAAYVQTQRLAVSFKTERVGPFLDFSGGIAFDFPDNRFDNSYVQKAGAWLTGGYENGNSGITTMFIARYLYHPDVIFADPTGKLGKDKASTFDAGARALLSAFKDKFTFSGEALYRSVLGTSELPSSWRLVFSAEYDIGKNQKLTFAFGRNFDGAISKGGNIVSAINFIAGFGGARKVANK